MFERFENASGFLFDCDGCLLDSMGTWRGVEYSLIEMTGHDWTQTELEEMRAAPMTEAARIFHERHGVFDSNQAVTDYVNATMVNYYEHDAQAKPGAKEFVFALREAGVPCAVVSSSPLGFIKAGLTTCGMVDAFDALFSTKELGISKQDPRIWNYALEQIGADPRSAWGADDSLYAIRVINACGMSSIGTYDADDAGSFEQLSEEATLAIRSFEELLR